jgi:nitrogen fixation protein NifU and related proteins
MNDLQDLYQEIIIDHSKRPRNFSELAGATQEAQGYNPLCGDRVMVFLKMEGETIRDIRFQGTGCAISTASASLMTERLKGRTRAEAEDLFHRFHDLVAGDGSGAPGGPELGKLAVFSGVREYPVRVKCATLAWHAMRAALESRQKVVSTE